MSKEQEEVRNSIPKWITRNLEEFSNCYVSFKTFVREGLKDKLVIIYGSKVLFKHHVPDKEPGAKRWLVPSPMVTITIIEEE